MRIIGVQPNNFIQHSNVVSKQQSSNKAENKYSSNVFAPIYYQPVSFTSNYSKDRIVGDIDFKEYKTMTPTAKEINRKKIKYFSELIDPSQLFDPNQPRLPLQEEKNMDEFLRIAKMYSKFKDQPIICLGRSPKWFLNATLWMKDGIDDYKFVAFSKYWHRPDPIEGMIKMNILAPTPEEEVAYRKYLKRIQADPETIVKHFEETGKKTVITDYICSSKGICSFLDVMSSYADDLGILERFSKSIQIVGIGCMEYMEHLDPYADSISEPRVIMPEKLIQYDRNIPQEFHDMKFGVFEEMLLNQNTNECRSTYYPHQTWTLYKPDQFKTGLIHDMTKVEKLAKRLQNNKKSTISFSPAMRDLRNLLNFRILDGLEARDLLKVAHKTRI